MNLYEIYIIQYAARYGLKELNEDIGSIVMK